MSAIMDQHRTWQEARKRLDGKGNNTIRTKAITLTSVSRGRLEQVVRISPDVPLPGPAKERVKPTAGKKINTLSRTDQRKAAAIIAYVARRHCISVAAIKGEQRFVDVVHARQEAYYRLMKEAAMSSPEVGRALGGRDHSTVLHGAKMYATRTGRRFP